MNYFILIMKKLKIKVACALLGGSLLFSSCIGSFAVWNQLKDWNQGIGNKFVNEIVFFALSAVQVYTVAYLADAVILNSIEFWSGSNPLAEVGTTKTVKGQNGEYLIKTNEDGYSISKVGEDASIDLVYNQENRTWNATCEGETYEFMKMNEDGTITVMLQDGNTVTVLPDQMGLASVRALSGSKSSLYTASR